MKKYNTQFIKDFIEKNAENIDFVVCGMKEDWNWTSEKVYTQENGFKRGFDWNSKHIRVAGIKESVWATPVMKVCYKDGTSEVIECFVDNGEEADQENITMKMAFAKATGGMDSVLG